MQGFNSNARAFPNPSFIKKSFPRLDLGAYWFWAVGRVILTLLPQTGYIHPDEYFQTVEVFAGDVFKTEVSVPWEFNRTFPIRSIPVIYSTVFVPFSLLRSVTQLLEQYAGIRIISPYILLVTPRLTMCMISFISDYCLFKICYLFGQNYKERLIIFASSYVTLIFMTRTFTNSMEVALFNILLFFVSSCIAESEKTQYQHDYLKDKYNEAQSIVDKVKINKLMKLLPKHSLKRCIPIALVTTAGFFNRPTFAFYAVTPLFYWFERGLTPSSFLKDFHIRMFVFIFYCCPIICIFIFIDSVYYGYITWGEILSYHISLDNFVVTPLNFARYNLDSNNLSKHGIHPRFLHALVNIPLLFNVLGIYGMMVVLKLLIRSSLSNWTLLPKSQSITGMMTISFIAPLLLLSIFPHQEPRFLTPLLIPLVFLYSHLISDFEEECKTMVPYRKRFPKEKKGQGIFKYPMKCINYVEKMTESIDNRYNINGRYLTSIKLQEVVRKGGVQRESSAPEQAPEPVKPSTNRLMKVWYAINVTCVLFFGFIHQGGVYSLTRHFHNEILTKPRFTTYHLVTSHVYSLPLHLLMLKSSYKTKNTNFQSHELGTDNFENIHYKLIATLNAAEVKRKTRRRNYRVFYALPTSLFNEFRFSYHYYSSNYTYDIVDVYYPHFSGEALPNVALNVTDAGDFLFSRECGILKAIDFLPVRYIIEFLHQFGLLLLEISLRDPAGG
ncbi:UNVERIFIED_CONTAM: hypothetical protein PYX00_005015 [Menopon gallinae]|uniref:Mannosyltransferase n=1 Tax=Menopon gallinae TaxID=328185 RepID=A0AAW2I7L1_9NEOP